MNKAIESETDRVAARRNRQRAAVERLEAGGGARKNLWLSGDAVRSLEVLRAGRTERAVIEGLLVRAAAQLENEGRTSAA